MKPLRDFDAVVIGAGPVAMAAALKLSEHCHTVLFTPRVPALSDPCSVEAVPASLLALLIEFGIHPHQLARSGATARGAIDCMGKKIVRGKCLSRIRAYRASCARLRALQRRHRLRQCRSDSVRRPERFGEAVAPSAHASLPIDRRVGTQGRVSSKIFSSAETLGCQNFSGFTPKIPRDFGFENCRATARLFLSFRFLQADSHRSGRAWRTGYRLSRKAAATPARSRGRVDLGRTSTSIGDDRREGSGGFVAMDERRDGNANRRRRAGERHAVFSGTRDWNLGSDVCRRRQQRTPSNATICATGGAALGTPVVVVAPHGSLPLPGFSGVERISRVCREPRVQ